MDENYTGVLLEKWNGLERGSDSWCQAQVKILTDRILESADVEGIRAFIGEMSRDNLQEAAKYSGRIIEHLFKLKYSTSGNESLFEIWYREISHFQGELSSVFLMGANKDLLTTYREDLIKYSWKFGVSQYKRDSGHYSDLAAGLKKIPKENPFTPEELMELSIDELLKKLD